MLTLHKGCKNGIQISKAVIRGAGRWAQGAGRRAQGAGRRRAVLRRVGVGWRRRGGAPLGRHKLLGGQLRLPRPLVRVRARVRGSGFGVQGSGFRVRVRVRVTVRVRVS